MYQYFDDDLMFDLDEDGSDGYDADYAGASPVSPSRSLTPAQRRWNAWIRSLQRENRLGAVRNASRQAIESARQAGARFGNARRILAGGNRRGNSFDRFDAWDESFDDLLDEFDLLEDGDFDAASPNIRQQRARAEQQRRRRLAQTQRRARRRQPQARRRARQSQSLPPARLTPVIPVEIPPSQRPTIIDPIPPSQRPTVYNPIPIPPEAYPSGRVSFDAYDEYDDYLDDYLDAFDAWDEDIDAGIGQGLRNLWGRFRRRISPGSTPPQLPAARRRIGFRSARDPEFITDPLPPPPGMRRRIGFRRAGDPEYIPNTFDL